MLVLRVSTVVALWCAVGCAAQTCRKDCKKLVSELPVGAECRDYRMQLPRPKVGKSCTDGFAATGNQMCELVCSGSEDFPKRSVVVADACRAKMKEYPKPTLGKACKHGAERGFEMAIEAAREFFSKNGVEDQPPVQGVENKEPPAPPPVEEKRVEVEEPPRAAPSEIQEPKLLASLPVTVDEEEVYLKVYSGQDATAEILDFCGKWMSDSVESCIKQLTPHVEKKIANALAAET